MLNVDVMGVPLLVGCAFLPSPRFSFQVHPCHIYVPTYTRSAGEHIPDLRHLRSRNTSMVVISRAPFAKLDAWKNKIGWTFPWYSSEGSDFNHDFHVTSDPAVGPVEYNFASSVELEAKGLKWHLEGEQPGLSVFFRKDGAVYHTYSAYARGAERLLGTYQLLDMTPLGRQDSPKGPAEFRLKYEYDEEV